MSKVVKVNLNMGKGTVELVAGKNRTNGHYGVAVFNNGKYLLNFVVLEDDAELLASDLKAKYIKDIGFILMASTHNMEIMYLENTTPALTHFLRKVDETEEAVSSRYQATYSTVRFTSHNNNAFCEALKIVLDNPYTEAQIINFIPEDAEVIEL